MKEIVKLCELVETWRDPTRIYATHLPTITPSKLKILLQRLHQHSTKKHRIAICRYIMNSRGPFTVSVLVCSYK